MKKDWVMPTIKSLNISATNTQEGKHRMPEGASMCGYCGRKFESKHAFNDHETYYDIQGYPGKECEKAPHGNGIIDQQALPWSS